MCCDPIVVDLADGALDFLDDVKDRLVGDTAALVSLSRKGKSGNVKWTHGQCNVKCYRLKEL